MKNNEKEKNNESGVYRKRSVVWKNKNKKVFVFLLALLIGGRFFFCAAGVHGCPHSLDFEYVY